jgi:hypothetical protein
MSKYAKKIYQISQQHFKFSRTNFSNLSRTDNNRFWILLSSFFSIVVTLPAIFHPLNTFVGTITEDSALVSGYMNALLTSQTWLFSESLIQEIAWPQGIHNPGEINLLTSLSSLTTYALSVLFTPLTAQLVLVFASLSSAFFLCRKIAYRISQNICVSVFLCVAVSISAMSLQWASALPILGMNSFFLVLIYLQITRIESQKRFQLSFVATTIVSCLWHPYFTSFVCILLIAATLTELFILHKISLTLVISWIAVSVYVAVFAAYFSSTLGFIKWTGENIAIPEKQNLLQYSFFEATSRAYLHPVVILLALFTLVYFFWHRNFIGLTEKIVIYNSLLMVMISFVAFGPFYLKNFKLPAFYLNEYIPGLRNGQYAVALVQIGVSLISTVGLKLFFTPTFKYKEKVQRSLLVLFILISIVSSDFFRFKNSLGNLVAQLSNDIFQINQTLAESLSLKFQDLKSELMVLTLFFTVVAIVLIIINNRAKIDFGNLIIKNNNYKLILVAAMTFSFLSNLHLPKIDNSIDRWMVRPTNFELSEIKQTIQSLPPGALLVSPFETYLSTSGLTCLLLVDRSHPLVNSCGMKSDHRTELLIEKIYSAQNCEKISLARNAQVKYLLVWNYSSANSEKNCLYEFEKKKWADEIVILEKQNVGLWEFIS